MATSGKHPSQQPTQTGLDVYWSLERFEPFFYPAGDVFGRLFGADFFAHHAHRREPKCLLQTWPSLVEELAVDSDRAVALLTPAGHFFGQRVGDLHRMGREREKTRQVVGQCVGKFRAAQPRQKSLGLRLFGAFGVDADAFVQVVEHVAVVAVRSGWRCEHAKVMGVVVIR